jgi:hypothetical protein
MNLDELNFIKKHKLNEDLFYNAYGLPISIVRPVMLIQERLFAYNVKPCKKGKHKLYTRSGHCIQCDHKKIAFMLRYIAAGTIYIAGSIKSQLIKVGFTNDREKRIESIRKSLNCYDWEILYFKKVLKDGGNLEHQIHQKLEKYRWSEQYFHDNHHQYSKELYRCSFERAKSAFIEVVMQKKDASNKGTKFINSLLHKGIKSVVFSGDYNFPNILSK